MIGQWRLPSSDSGGGESEESKSADYAKKEGARGDLLCLAQSGKRDAAPAFRPNYLKLSPFLFTISVAFSPYHLRYHKLVIFYVWHCLDQTHQHLPAPKYTPSMAEGQQQTAASQPSTQTAQQSQRIPDVIRGYRPCKVC